MEKLTKNLKFIRDGEGNCTTRPATKKEIAEGRKKAKACKGDFEFRSCYECNSAHAHLMGDDRIINCFGCGRWFVDGTDIMDYSTQEK